jgi:hypothetical protein
MRTPRPQDWSEQLLLFEPARVRPRWENLPAPPRQEAVRLMAKMLSEFQASGGANAPKREGNDE